MHNNNYLISFVLGTRPEAIKLAPLILEFKKNEKVKINIVLSGQHEDMIRSVMDMFDLKEDINLNILRRSISLDQSISLILSELSIFLDDIKPDIVFVQGDTVTAFAGALAAFLKRIPVAHVEAGLRTENIYSPFPEEANRRMISQITSLHFPPTKIAFKNLSNNGINKNVFISGNTVVDALNIVSKKINHPNIKNFDIYKEKYILTTVHRRENWGNPIRNIAKGIQNIAAKNKNLKFLIPMHKNPSVRVPLVDLLGKNKNILLIEPLPYPEFILTLKHSIIVLTDSGGIQEEAHTLGKPTLILRDSTERPEVLIEGNAVLVGNDSKRIEKEFNNLIKNSDRFKSSKKNLNTFGDGNSSEFILEKTIEFLKKEFN
tara:strand:- start:803 stop:1927 length:1125 start_codon:yes stop_codon:yes gene_type:complete